MHSETRVLIIDDNTDLTKIICMILSAEGLSVKECGNLEDGIFCLRDWKPGLILLDVNINGDDSRNFCHQIKSEMGENIKVILMSGDESTLDYTEWSGADDYISKPFDTNLLIQKISMHLAGNFNSETD
jgi:DNA-binding response OmpR family regulator